LLQVSYFFFLELVFLPAVFLAGDLAPLFFFLSATLFTSVHRFVSCSWHEKLFKKNPGTSARLSLLILFPKKCNKNHYIFFSFTSKFSRVIFFAMASETQLTPMMAQYRRIKSELPGDALLLFRLGDFYEMFFEDAREGAQLLNVTLTKRGAVPMCGIPFHAAAGYIGRLLKSGRKVAICDQVEDAKPGQLVRREVTQILSPGTHFDERMLNAERNNYLAAIYPRNEAFGLSVVDLTTGDFKVTELESDTALLGELERLRPAEIIYPGESAALAELLRPYYSILIGYEDWVFAPETSKFTLQDHFKVASLDGFGLNKRGAAIGAAGAVIHYLAQHLRRDVANLTRITCYESRDYLVLDATTLRNLEVLEPLRRDAPREASLFGALNRTVTPMGARRLREWLAQPLSSAEGIRERQEVVAQWLSSPALLEEFRAALREARDLERTISRLSVATGNARDLQAIRVALIQIPGLRQLIQNLGMESGARSEMRESLLAEEMDSGAARRGLMEALSESLIEMPETVELIGRSIVEEPPLALKEGGLVKEGYDAHLDELRRGTREGKEWIAQLQQREIEKTGISTLKIRFNSVFGYFIEVTKSHLAKVPPEYIRKQTVANAERFITPELKEMEGKILGAEERATKLEYEIFLKVREATLGRLTDIQKTADALAHLDVLTSFAENAWVHSYTRPEIGEEGIIAILDGRHPVLDQAIHQERFVPNDLELNPASQQVMIITGPNMAGKSTFIRQSALLTLLAHTGSFVPAASARIDLVDRIFTRIGASDDLSRGQSTFMVEMSETANILNNATSRSLIILDEVGRGTSTFDGLSLAWSLVEHLHNQIGAKTLFATHYHELTELAGRLPRVKNFNVAVREWNEQIIFLRKIIPGGTDKSYGIQVARLAGVPKAVLDRAKEILNNLEESELTPEGRARSTARQRERRKLQELPPAPQLDLFQ
jgi:DNA mismatch repair protein MutS